MCQGTWWRVSQCVSGATISPFIKGGSSRASAVACLLRATSSAQLIRHTCGLSYQNRLWCHWSIIWWCPDDASNFGGWHINLKGVMWMSCSDDVGGFGWCHLHHKRGIKGRPGRGVWLLRFQLPSSRDDLIELGQPPSEYLGTPQHWVSHKFLHPSQIMC